MRLPFGFEFNRTSNSFVLCSEFLDPDRDERLQYAQYWQGKLKNNKKIEFPDKLANEIADETSGFSFAYLKEAL